jgi:phage terminase small subunit
MAQKVTLSPKQTKALTALLTTGEVTQAASAAGVTRKTVHKWLLLPQFQEALEKGEGEAFKDATRRLSGLLGKSIDELEKLLVHDGLPVVEKIRVVRTILDTYPRLREMTSFESRLLALEESLNE